MATTHQSARPLAGGAQNHNTISEYAMNLSDEARRGKDWIVKKFADKGNPDESNLVPAPRQYSGDKPELEYCRPANSILIPRKFFPESSTKLRDAAIRYCED